MKIRSITVFCPLSFPPNRLLLQQIGIFASHAKSVFEDAGFAVENCRLASQPFPKFVSPTHLTEAAQNLAIEAHAEGFSSLALGPALTDNAEYYPLIPEALAQSGDIFLSASLTTTDGRVSLAAAKACARVIENLAPLEPEGFANLRFCALANVAPFAPFFPAAYGDEAGVSFALAIEGADLALQAFSGAGSLEEARARLEDGINLHARRLEQACRELSQWYHYTFKGLDFTLAPYPDQARSIAGALEALGVPALGLHGSLFASAFLTSTLDGVGFTRTGFNGLMLPVLEDSGIAARAAQGTLGVNDLLLYSAVCGTGLDVIPLPGDTTAEDIYPLLLDLAALALRLKKPLTARLLPIPGKKAGDETHFSFDYFANSRVMPLRSARLSGVMAQNESVKIDSRYRL